MFSTFPLLYLITRTTGASAPPPPPQPLQGHAESLIKRVLLCFSNSSQPWGAQSIWSTRETPTFKAPHEMTEAWPRRELRGEKGEIHWGPGEHP